METDPAPSGAGRLLHRASSAEGSLFLGVTGDSPPGQPSTLRTNTEKFSFKSLIAWKRGVRTSSAQKVTLGKRVICTWTTSLNTEHLSKCAQQRWRWSANQNDTRKEQPLFVCLLAYNSHTLTVNTRLWASSPSKAEISPNKLILPDSGWTFRRTSWWNSQALPLKNAWQSHGSLWRLHWRLLVLCRVALDQELEPRSLRACVEVSKLRRSFWYRRALSGAQRGGITPEKGGLKKVFFAGWGLWRGFGAVLSVKALWIFCCGKQLWHDLLSVCLSFLIRIALMHLHLTFNWNS